MPRYTRRIAATIAAATATAGLAVPAMSSAEGATQSVHGELKAGGLIQMNFDATKGADGITRGHMDGQIVIGKSAPVAAKGPITCMDVRGKKVGLFYPMKDSKPSVMGKAMRGVQVTVETDGKGNAKSMSFVPTLSPDAKSCAPTVGMIPAKGSTVIGS